MKRILLPLFFLVFSSACSEKLTEDERNLKAYYDILIENAGDKESKKQLELKYEEALDDLRAQKKEEEFKATLKYDKNNDATDSLFLFINEIWENKDYNPAKFSVTENAFKYKSISFTSQITRIHSEDNSHYLTFYYLHDEREIDWLNSETRTIVFLVDFEKPEDIMNFQVGDYLDVKCIYDHAFIGNDYFDDQSYFFSFFNPNVVLSTQQNSISETNNLIEIKGEIEMLETDFNAQLAELQQIKGLDKSLDELINERVSEIQSHLVEIKEWMKSQGFTNAELIKIKERVVVFESEREYFITQVDELVKNQQ